LGLFSVTADIQIIRVVDLIEAGLLSRAAKLHGYHGQDRLEATVKGDGTIIYGTKIYSSPSVAAGEAITSKSGKTAPGRNYFSVNGWRFWQVTDRSGATKSLADLRLELFETRGRASGNN
jgi:hypothetical protein